MERLLREACGTPALCKLDALARDLTGVGLLAVWTCGDQHGQIPVCGNEHELPLFCQLLHDQPQGLSRCVTCHSLLAMAAHNSGQVIEGRCYGGAFVVAAPAVLEGLAPRVDVVVISTCAFTLPDRRQGWRTTRKIASDLGIDLEQLRRAYTELPELHGSKLKVIGEIVDAASASLTEALRSRIHPEPGDGKEPAEQEGIDQQLQAALRAPQEPALRHATGSAQRTLVDVVRRVVGANPQLPISVADIARTAHLTPNHFSLVFRRQTGTTFSEFLAEKRFERATEGLKDLRLTIAQVAQQAGFNDPNYFAKVFHKRTGMSPRQWRQPRRKAVKPF